MFKKWGSCNKSNRRNWEHG